MIAYLIVELFPLLFALSSWEALMKRLPPAGFRPVFEYTVCLPSMPHPGICCDVAISKSSLMSQCVSNHLQWHHNKEKSANHLWCHKWIICCEVKREQVIRHYPMRHCKFISTHILSNSDVLYTSTDFSQPPWFQDHGPLNEHTKLNLHIIAFAYA